MISFLFNKSVIFTLTLISLLGLGSSALAQDCWDYSSHLHWLTEMELAGTPLAVVARGDFLFVADEQAGLQVVSIVDPAAPAVVHTVSGTTDARDVVIGGDFAYVATGAAGLLIVDITVPASASVIGSAGTVGSAVGLFLKDTLALVAVENFGLQIFNVANATTPQLLSSVSTPGEAYGVTADRYFAYVADGLSGIQIVNIVDPAAAFLAGEADTPGNAKDLVARERLLFAADGGGGLTVVERIPTYFSEASWQFSDSTEVFDSTGNHPGELFGEAELIQIGAGIIVTRALFTPDSTSYVEYESALEDIIVGRISFVFKLDSLFVADPTFDEPINFITAESPGFNAGDCRVSLDPVDGRMTFLQDDPDLGAAVELKTNVDTWNKDTWYRVEVTWDDLGRAFQVTWIDSLGSHLDSGSDNYVAAWFGNSAVQRRLGSRGENAPPGGLTLDWLKVDRSVPGGLVAAKVPLPGFANDLELVGDHAFLAAAYGDLHVVDLTVPKLPVVVGAVDLHDRAHGVAVTANHVFVVDQIAGLQVIGYTTPTSPEPYGALATPGFAYGLAILGNTALIADRQAGLQVVDIGVPTVPQMLATVATTGNAMAVAAAGNHAYVAEANFAKTAGGSWDQSLLARALFPRDAVLAGDKLGAYSGLQIVDVTNPAAPVVQGTVETPGFALDVAVAGNYAYVADFVDFLVIDVSDPTAPAIVGIVNTPGGARDLAVSASHAFVADLSGLQIIDISVPAAPQLVGSLSTPGGAYGVAVSGNLAYVADVVAGLHVIDVSDPAAPVLLGTVATPGGAFAVEIIGNYAYVADGFDTSFSSLQVVDVSLPGAPRLVGDFDTPGPVYSVAVEGDYAFVTDDGNDLQILGRQCDTGFLAPPGLTVASDGLVVRADAGPVEIVPGLDLSFNVLVKNVGDRSAWGRLVLEYEDDAGVRQPIASTAVYAARLGAAGSELAVEFPWTVLDAQTVIHATLVEVDPADGDLAGNHAQRPLLAHTLTVYPSEFALVNDDGLVSFGWNPPPVVARDVFRLTGASGGAEWEIAYEWDDTGRILAIDKIGEQYRGQEIVYSLYYHEPGQDWALIAIEKLAFETPRIVTRLVGSHPNPFNPKTTVSFGVAAPQQVQIKVFDLAGRLVVVLTDQVYPAGYHTVSWNGGDTTGQGVASGVYFLRLEAGAVTDVQKLTLVR